MQFGIVATGFLEHRILNKKICRIGVRHDIYFVIPAEAKRIAGIQPLISLFILWGLNPIGAQPRRAHYQGYGRYAV